MNSQVYFENIRERIIETIDKCEFDLKIAVAWFTDTKLLSKVEELSRRGVKVKIIIYDDHINQKKLFEKLYYNGAEVFLSKKLMHNKFCVIDGKTVINGSYNWTYSAISNEENIIITDEVDVVSSFVNNFKVLINSQNNDISNYFRSEKEKFEQEFDSFVVKNNFPTKYPFFYKQAFKRRNVLNLFNNLRKLNHNLFLYLLVKSKSDLKEIFKISKKKQGLIYIPMSFFFNVFDVDDNSNVVQFESTNLLVEAEGKGNGRSYICLINKEGKIVNEIIYIETKYTNSRNETYFVSKENRLHRIYDVNLKYKEIECNSLWFENDLIYTRGLTGIFRANGTQILPTIYNRIRKKDVNTYILESSPILRGCRKFVRRDTDNFYEEHFKFNSKTLELNQIIFNSNPDLHYLSDDNGKWIEFYPKILELKYNIVRELKSRFKESSSSKIREEIDNVISEMTTEIDNKKSKNEGCYIATMVYQDYNHPKVITLRVFRDEVLKKYHLGKWLVSKYYKYSPSFVKSMQDSFWVKPIKVFVETIVFILEKTYCKKYK